MHSNNPKDERRMASLMAVLEKYVHPDELAAAAEQVVDVLSIHDSAYDRIENVKTFMTYAGSNIPPYPVQPVYDDQRLYIKLLFEEVSEYAYACGGKAFTEFRKMCATFADSFEEYHVHEHEGNLIEQVDALVDIDYVMNNAIVGSGLVKSFAAAHKFVHDNNMSKFCLSMEEANQTVVAYRAGGLHGKPAMETYYTKIGDLYIIRNKDTNKIMPSINYSKIVPSQLLNVVTIAHTQEW